MADTFSSLDKQIAEVEENLRLVAERKSEYPQAENIPLDLIKNERRLESKLADLRARRQRLRDVPCPYRGLEIFDVQHATNYFGREAMVQKLLAKLRETNFVAVVGPSGCGKSSLVRAGLLPALNRGELPDSEAWQIEIFRPGDDPLRSLALVLIGSLMPEASTVDLLAEARKLAGHLRERSLPVADVLAQLRGQLPSLTRLVLIADQFEEAYTLCHDDMCRRAFLDALLEASDTPWVTVLFTLRADFYGRVLGDERFGRRVDAGLVNVLPMTRDERRLAVEKPTLQVGGRFEEGLVERILDEVENAPGDLPLLEFALTELWLRHSAAGVLTHQAYEEIGEVSGAIARRADSTLAALDTDQTLAVRAVFMRLVRLARPDEGAEDTRRRTDLDELPAEAQPLVKQLADARLLVTSTDPATGKEAVEVAHEALIRGWRTLQDWLNGDREFLLWRQRLRTLAAIWDESGRGEETLLRGAILQEAQVRSAGRTADLSPLEKAFIANSQALHEREEQAREAARHEQLAQAQALAAEQQRRAEAEEERAESEALSASRLRRRNRVLVVAVTLLFIVAIFAVASFLRADTAQKSEVNARQTAEAEVVIRSTAQAVALAREAEAQSKTIAEAQARQTAKDRTEVASMLLAVQKDFVAQIETGGLSVDKLKLQIHRLELIAQVVQEGKVPKVTLQDLTGQNYADAMKQLDSACQPEPCLRSQVRWETNEEIQAGEVLGSEPPAGGEPLLWGAAVTLVVSQGKPMRIESPVRMEFVPVPSGEFRMGTDNDTEAYPNEKPQHTVDLSEFYIGKYPVTNDQYAAFVKATDWKDGRVPPGKGDHPVVDVSWDDAVEFTLWLSKETGTSFRLPTEAEWEKACRGTAGQIYPWGDNTPSTELNFFNNNGTTSVGSYSPQGDSPYGVADMAGNVWEWVADWYDEHYYSSSPAVNPQGPKPDPNSTDFRVLRGGSFFSNARFVRCATRVRMERVYHANDRGFRVAWTPSSASLTPTAVSEKNLEDTTIQEAQPHTIVVDAKEMWQNTGILVAANQLLDIQYVSGNWSVRQGFDDPTDGRGQEERPEQCRLYPPFDLGALVGQIGDGTPFEVGNGTTVRSPDAGTLFLSMNDCDNFQDNDGSLMVEVRLVP